MRYGDVPRVRDGALRFTTNAADEQAPVVVGSVEWYHLLEEIASFGFEDKMGRSFTARRERRKQEWYWYAYRKRGKKLRKVYLGKAEQLEPARLEAAARELADLTREAQPEPSPAPHTRRPAGPASAERVNDVFLRSTKLRIPATPGNLLQRPRLTQQLRRPLQDAPAGVSPNQGRSQTLLTVITAPAGCGKSTLLSEWLQQMGNLDVGWLSLDSEDNDVQQFWRYVVAALQTGVPGLGNLALAFLQEIQPRPIADVLTVLLDDIQRTPHTLALVLDDYHFIDTPAIHESLAFFLTHCPVNLHVVISSRTLPPLPLGRLRLQANVTEIQAAELRLTDEEGLSLLSRDPRLARNHQAIATV